MAPIAFDREPERICVFRALQLGDLICAGPALRALRTRFPAAHITLIGLPWAADFARRMRDCIDEHVEFPGWPGLPERTVDRHRLPDFLAAMRERRFDLALQLHGNGRLSNRVVQALQPACMVGYHPVHGAPTACEGSEDIDAEISAPWASRTPAHCWPYPEGLHEVHRCLALVARLGAPADDDRVSFPLQASDHAELRARRPDLASLTPRRYVCLHPGARDPARWWPAHSFAVVGDALADDGWTVVLTGNAAEHALAEQVRNAMHAPAINAACDISIGALAALLSQARLLVSNDTGVAHVAAGLGLRSVVLFLASDRRRWAALDASRHIALGKPGPVSAVAAINAARRLLEDSRVALPV